MKIFCVQSNIAWEDKSANYNRAEALLAGKEIPAGSLVVFPEMFPTGFSMNVPAVRETEQGETEAFLSGLARRRGIFVQAGLVTANAAGRGRNESVTFSPQGERLARYAKLHPFSLGGETQHYDAGSEIITFPWQGFAVAPFICYDLRFPEIFRVAAKKGAQLFTVIANWPVKREHHWILLLRARAIENQAYVAGVNRCGADPSYIYSGRSMIVDPHGEIIADAGNEEGVISAEVEMDAVVSWRRDFPALRDMRAEFLR